MQLHQRRISDHRLLVCAANGAIICCSCHETELAAVGVAGAGCVVKAVCGVVRERARRLVLLGGGEGGRRTSRAVDGGFTSYPSLSHG
jgi:hypothetical protein